MLIILYHTSKSMQIMKGSWRGTIVVSTFSDEGSASEIARRVLEAKLCACVNITRIRSMYRWKGKLEDQQEYLAIFKTTKLAAPRLKKSIASLHPYDVPEIVELEMRDVSKPYLSWMVQETSPNRVSKERNNPSKRRDP